MKKILDFRKSKLLLFMLFAMIAGASPVWAQEATTEEFSDDDWPTGWSLGGTATASDYYLETDADFYSTPTPKRGVYGQVSSGTAKYIVTPVVNGSGSFQFKRRNSSNGSVYVYTIEDGSLSSTTITSNTSKPTSWTTVSFSGVENKRLAIVLNGRLDKFTYTPGSESPYKSPATATFESVTANSAVVNWTVAETTATLTAWNLEYKVANSDTWTEVHNIANGTTSYNFTGLTSNTNYDVRIQAVYGSEVSGWTTGSFKTLKVATVAEGFTDDFETDKGWETINSSVNKWYIGSGTNNGGSNALYISNDNGETNAYTNNSATVSYATKYFSFVGGDYAISYDWKALGESDSYDFLRVFLAPDVDFTAGTLYSGLSATALPSGWIALDGGSYLSGKDSWQNKSVNVSIPAGNYLVVFVWKNDGYSGSNPPAAVDNFSITKQALSVPTEFAYSNLTATSVDLSWTANSAEIEWQVKYGATGFDVETEGTAVVATTNPYTLTVEPETAYDVYVRAKADENYSGWSNKVSFTTPELYLKPTGVTSSNVAATTATISWTKNGTETTWEYSCSTSSDEPAEDGSYTIVDAVSANLTGLTESTTYYVYVRAKVGDEHSKWSEVHSFITTQVPLDLTTGSFDDDFESDNNWAFVNGTLTNAWTIGTATANGGTKSMYISNDGGTSNNYSSSNAMVYATKLFTLAQGKYDISYDWKARGESNYDYLRAAIVPASTTLVAGTTAPTGFGTSSLPSGWIAIDGGSKLNLSTSWVNKVTEAEIPEAGNYYVVFAWLNDNGAYNPAAAIDNFSIAFQACPKPTGVDKTDVKGNKATLVWDAAEDTTWELYISTESAKPADNQEATASSNTNSYTFIGLTAMTDYYAWVRAVKNEAKSDWVGVSFTTDVQYPAPTALTASNLGATSVTLTWTAGDEETKWELAYSTENSTPAEEGDFVEVSTTSYEITELTASTTYYAWVRAKGNDGHSAWSAVYSFTTAYATPFAQDFKVSSIPTGWIQYSGLMDNVIAGTANLTSGSGWSFGTSNGVFDTQHAYVNVYGTSCNKWLVSPSIELGSNNQIAFDLALTAYSGTKKAAQITGTDDKFAVLIATNNGSTWTKVAQWDNAGSEKVYNNIATEGETVRLNLSDYNNQTVQLAFYVESTTGNADNNLHIANVEIAEAANYSILISGSDVSENTIAFGTVKNATTTKTFTITNNGGEELTDISVVSSDNSVFTVSDTGFDLASGASKDITVTFVKEVAADYSETITISQANVTTPIVLTATATYVVPTPATMALTLNDLTIGEIVEFGTVGKAKSKTFTVSNSGEATLNITSIESSNTTDFTVTPATLEVAGGETGEFTVTFVWDGEALNAEKTATITVTSSNEGLQPVSFSVTGTRDNLWMADFEGENPLEGWENSGFTVKATAGSSNNIALTSNFAVSAYTSSFSTLTTPLLMANAGDKLTFDAFFLFGDDPLKVEYSTDGVNFNEENPLLSFTGSPKYAAQSYTSFEIEAPITGDFYLRFSTKYGNAIDNIEGFKLAPAREHDAVIVSSSIPSYAYQYREYTASVTVQEKAGKDDEVVTAELWVNGEKVAMESGITLTASDNTVITLKFTPDEDMTAVEAYIKVYNDNLDMTSDVQTLNVYAATILDEEDGTVTTGTKNSMVVKYTAKTGWNTICMPFNMTDEFMTELFGAGYKVYQFQSYEDDVITFAPATTLESRIPYLVYAVDAPENAEGVKLLYNIYIDKSYASYVTKNGVTFQGTYAPVAAGSMAETWYGVTNGGEIRKAGSGASLKGFRAYFTGVTELADARIAVVDESTGITTIIAARELNNDKVYNLNGQRVENAKKGLYIVNGKKVVVK